MTRVPSFCLIALVSSLFVAAAPSSSLDVAKPCVGMISSLSDVNYAVQCKTVNIYGFTVPSGKTLNLALLDGTTVNLYGDITFSSGSAKGPLFQINGKSVLFNGNGHKVDGGGPHYWDGKGSNGGKHKPAPMLKLKMSGEFRNTVIFNSPAQAVSVSNPQPLVIKGVTVDNSQGDQPNSQSGGKPAGHNTDAFDCSTTDLVIENSIVKNQDDCIAINKGSNILFQNNKCFGGHGISIGSIGSGVTVSNITVKGNTIMNSDQALRIKTDASAYGSVVQGVTYSGNQASSIRRFGVLIDQSYPKTMGQPGSGVVIKDVSFVGDMNTILVESSAFPLAVNCGKDTCSGKWDWSSLQISGGNPNSINNAPSIAGLPSAR